MNKTSSLRAAIGRASVMAALACTLGGVAPRAAAQLTDLAREPLTAASATTVKPNLMFILDDSGSMGSDYMPDDANMGIGRYGRYASQCNGLAYNPSITYQVPVDAAGDDMATGTYTFQTPANLPYQRSVTSAAPAIATGNLTLTLSGPSVYYVGDSITVYSSTDPTRWMFGVITGWNGWTSTVTIDITETSGGTGTLASAWVGDGDARPFYVTYSGTQTPLNYAAGTASTFYLECNSVFGSAPGSSVFTRVVVTPTTITDNYRNWFTYHRTRMLTMRTATSRAFKGIDSNYRVGFSTISAEVVDGTKFLDVADFDATQKTTWYSRLFSSDPDAWTPLRGALSKAGMYYAKKGRLGGGGSQSYDPIQYSCQKNFAILTTDGYWNANDENAAYGPLRLDGSTTVGQQDAGAARPMRDGSTTTTETRTSLLQERTTTSQLQRATVQLQARERVLYTRTRSNGNWSSWTATTSCTWSNNPRRECAYASSWSNWADASSCTVASEGTGNSGTWGTARECRYTTSAWTNDNACTASSPPPSTGPTDYTVASATVCRTDTSTGSWTNTNSCTVSATKECQYTGWSSWTTVASCAAAPRSSSPNYTVGTARECRLTSTGGSTDSLADVAMYYYETDLRTTALGNCTLSNGIDVCRNNVKVGGDDNAEHQHMTTFTLGLGVNGTLGYHPNYLGGMSPDFQAIKAGTMNWPNPGDRLGGVNIDDLWHAAVNGRGQYFSASNSDALATSLTGALDAIKQRTGTASAAATSTLQPVPGDNTEFVTSFTTVKWVGDVVAYSVEPTTGVRSSTPLWRAQERLDTRVADGTARNIYYMQRGTGNTGTLRPFTFTNLTSDSLGTHFQNACSKTPALTQCEKTGFDVTNANNGDNLVNWLRGQTDVRYRNREHVLSDMVGGAPVYLGKSRLEYTEHGYQTWVSDMNATNSGAGRKGVVYVPSNGGMLHAFQASNGQELWAFVPTMVMDRMYRLADWDYANKHEFFVNATPILGDIWVPSLNSWRTILVGGLGAGGRGYYALDVTDPDNPRALWEFHNDSTGGSDNLGFTFGNPVITKRGDGRWVVMFTSGYNNVSPGDGNGRLFVVDAFDGERLTEIQTYTGPATPAGTATAPSGLAKINNWVDSQRDNTTLRVYGGDLLGNLWRFDIDGVVAPNHAALRLANMRAGSPVEAQPITTRPELATVTHNGTKVPVVYIGTGQMLGVSDLTDTSPQTVYAVKDPLTGTGWGDFHARTDVVAQTLSVNTSTDARTVTNHAVDWATKAGWRVDLPTTGERVNIDMRLAITTLVVGTNAPSTDTCTEGGRSYLYQFDYAKGSAQPNVTTVGESLGDSFVVGVGVMQLYSTTQGAGQGGTVARTQMGDGTMRRSTMYSPSTAAVEGRRTSWRELIN